MIRPTKKVFWVLSCNNDSVQPRPSSERNSCLQRIGFIHSSLLFSFTYNRKYSWICVLHIPSADSGPTIGCPAPHFTKSATRLIASDSLVSRSPALIPLDQKSSPVSRRSEQLYKLFNILWHIRVSFHFAVILCKDCSAVRAYVYIPATFFLYRKTEQRLKYLSFGPT